MLYLIHGTNTNKVRAKQKELIGIMQSKQPNVSLYKVTTENWSEIMMDELMSSQGLFLAKYIVTLDKILEDKEIGPTVVKVLKELKESDHAWIIIEEKILSVNLKKIEKLAQKVYDFNETTEGVGGGTLAKKQKPTAFNFAEQFAAKNKVGAWKEFLQLKEAELAGEEIHGVLWWQMKSVYLAKFCKTAEETGLAPYSYTKALRLSKGWELKELNNLMDSLVGMYHEAHRGNGDLLVGLEKASLTL
ncbi:MAG: hypothetical protein WCQ00_01085 [bacterium]